MKFKAGEQVHVDDLRHGAKYVGVALKDFDPAEVKQLDAYPIGAERDIRIGDTAVKAGEQVPAMKGYCVLDRCIDGQSVRAMKAKQAAKAAETKEQALLHRIANIETRLNILQALVQEHIDQAKNGKS